jgi:predicted nucleic acid-binding protein
VTFLDTNVLVYAVDKADRRKHAKALSIVETALDRPADWRISSHVLSEFSNVLLRKLKCPTARLLAFLDQLSAIPCFAMTPAAVRRAAEIQALHGLQFFDAQVVAAAEATGCERIFSEDLNDGQSYGAVTVENPFVPGR